MFIGQLSIVSAQSYEAGKASYYADKFQGRKTASGEMYHKDSMTCAHRTYSFGTTLKVISLKNDKSVIVRVNDRGPFVAGRIVDLSRKAMENLGGLEKGIIEVKIEILKPD